MPAGKGNWWETVSALELAYLSLATDDLAGKLGFGFVFLARFYTYQLAFKLFGQLVQNYSLILVVFMKAFFCCSMRGASFYSVNCSILLSLNASEALSPACRELVI